MTYIRGLWRGAMLQVCNSLPDVLQTGHAQQLIHILLVKEGPAKIQADN